MREYDPNHRYQVMVGLLLCIFMFFTAFQE